MDSFEFKYFSVFFPIRKLFYTQEQISVSFCLGLGLVSHLLSLQKDQLINCIGLTGQNAILKSLKGAEGEIFRNRVTIFQDICVYGLEKWKLFYLRKERIIVETGKVVLLSPQCTRCCSKYRPNAPGTSLSPRNALPIYRKTSSAEALPLQTQSCKGLRICSLRIDAREGFLLKGVLRNGSCSMWWEQDPQTQPPSLGSERKLRGAGAGMRQHFTVF